jgi:hypothetical protein
MSERNHLQEISDYLGDEGKPLQRVVDELGITRKEALSGLAQGVKSGVLDIQNGVTSELRTGHDIGSQRAVLTNNTIVRNI